MQQICLAICAGIALLYSATSLSASEPAPGPVPALEREAACSFRDMAARCSTTWAGGLHARLFTQDYRVRSADTGSLLFAGRGTYRLLDGGGVDGYWTDSFANLHPLRGRWDGTELSVTWGTEATEVGRSRYHFGPDGSLDVTDSVRTPDQNWRQFMQVHYPSPGAGPE